jgi:hypothetical protein
MTCQQVDAPHRAVRARCRSILTCRIRSSGGRRFRNRRLWLQNAADELPLPFLLPPHGSW